MTEPETPEAPETPVEEAPVVEESTPETQAENDAPADETEENAAPVVESSDPKVPGDPDYDALSDPVVPDSVLAQIVNTEVAGTGSSPTWDSLKNA